MLWWKWLMNGKMMDDMNEKMADEKRKWWMIYDVVKLKQRTQHHAYLTTTMYVCIYVCIYIYMHVCMYDRDRF